MWVYKGDGQSILYKGKEQVRQKKLFPLPEIPIMCQWALAWESGMRSGSWMKGKGP
jgi:hypothetical protein